MYKMSMIFLRCLILAEFLTYSHTAPKLGHILFDPLKYEAAMFINKDVSPSTLSNDAIRRFLRIQADKTTKKPCLGYEYDEELCKLLGDRIVCGYNKNVGHPTDTETVIDIGNGCFIRGDRVECGYVIGPFVNSRRPPSDQNQPEERNPVKLKNTISPSISLKTTEPLTVEVTEKLTSKPPISTSTSKSSVSSTYSSSKPKTTTVPTITTLLTSKAATTSPTEKTTKDKSEQIKISKKPRFKCVDKDNSLFCYELNEVK